MTRVRYLAWVLILVVSATASLSAADWQAGAAKVVITPERFLMMAGYSSRTKPADGKLSDLWAKALVLEDPEGHRCTFVTLDVVGIGREFSRSVCEALATRHGFKRDQIALCTSHTHSGPVIGKNLVAIHYSLLDKEQQEAIDEYAATLQNRIVDVVGQALAAKTPCRLAWGSGHATLAVNRRNNREPEVPMLRTAGRLVGPVDYDVPVLSVRDAQGQLRAVLFGYACHATVLSLYQWSADWPGYAQTELEQTYPDTVALFWAGCGADQNPLPRRTVELAQEHGRRVATAVDSVLRGVMRPVNGGLKTSYREIDLAFGTLPTREEVERDAKSENKYVATRAKLLAEQWEKRGRLDAAYPYPVSVWRLGDEVRFVTLGGEVVVDYAVRIKAETAGVRTWVAGYANDVMAYIPSRRVLLEGGYEGGGAMLYYGLPCPWSDAVEESILKEVHAQMAP